MPNSTGIRDQDYIVIADETILTVHGDVHPSDFFVGEITFVPDRSEGDRILLGRRYRKAHEVGGVTIREAFRPKLRDHGSTPFHSGHLFSAKSIVSCSRIVTHIDSTSPRASVDLGEAADRYVQATMAEVWRRFGDELEGISIGRTGSARLTSDAGARLHDLDVVFRGSVSAIQNLVAAMASAARRDPAIRLVEHGKSWQIRLATPGGVLCSFFSYADPSQSPLYGLTKMETIIPDVVLEALVVEDAQNSFHPTFLRVKPRSWSTDVPSAARRDLLVMINHLRGRGDFFAGDIGVFRGALVDVSSGVGDFVALSVVDGHSCISVTPPWPQYDDADRLLAHPRRGAFPVD